VKVLVIPEIPTYVLLAVEMEVVSVTALKLPRAPPEVTEAMPAPPQRDTAISRTTDAVMIHNSFFILHLLFAKTPPPREYARTFSPVGEYQPEKVESTMSAVTIGR